MTEEIIAVVVAGAISVALEVVPGLRGLWDRLATDSKALVVFLLCLLLPPVFVGAACLGVDVGAGAVCPDPANAQMWFDALKLGVFAYLGSQVAFEFLSLPMGKRIAAEPAG